jgi:AraC-like DNA-binding protein
MATNYRFSGDIIADHSSSLGGVVLSAHCAATAVAGHRHERGYASICVDGGYVQVSRGETDAFVAGTARLQLDGCHHRNDFGSKGAIVLSLQPSSRLLDLFSIDLAQRADAHEAAEANIADLNLTNAEKGDRALIALCMALARNYRSNCPAFDAELEAGSSIGQFASAAGATPWQLSRMFKSAYGATPSHYRLKRRLGRALEHYVETQDSWTAAAHAAGFADSAHLSRTCKKLLGCAPSSLAVRH